MGCKTFYTVPYPARVLPKRYLKNRPRPLLIIYKILSLRVYEVSFSQPVQFLSKICIVLVFKLDSMIQYLSSTVTNVVSFPSRPCVTKMYTYFKRLEVKSKQDKRYRLLYVCIYTYVRICIRTFIYLILLCKINRRYRGKCLDN